MIRYESQLLGTDESHRVSIPTAIREDARCLFVLFPGTETYISHDEHTRARRYAAGYNT